MFYRLQKYGYRKFPSVIPDPDRAAILRDSRSTDNRDNAETEPPADETIDTKCIWAVELYTPSQISELLHRFEKLGWNRDDPTNPDRSPVDWIQSFRESARGGGWFNLGPLYRHGDRRFFYRGREAPLPEGVDYAVASMYSLTSSVTCVVIGFLLDDEHGRKFEDALRLDRQSIVEPLRGRGYRLPGPCFSAPIRHVRLAGVTNLAKAFQNLPVLEFASSITPNVTAPAVRSMPGPHHSLKRPCRA